MKSKIGCNVNRVLLLIVILGFVLLPFVCFKGDKSEEREDVTVKEYMLTATNAEEGVVVASVADENQYISALAAENYQAASNGRRYSIEELKAMFPHGKYWNHANNPGCFNHNTYCCVSPDSVTDTPCSSVYFSVSSCHIYSVGSQCHGLALRLSDLYWNANNETFGLSHSINDITVGSVVRFRYYNSGFDHTIFITGISADGSTYYYTDCNFTGNCQINWSGKISRSELDYLLKLRLYSTYDYPNQYSETGFILCYDKRIVSIEECDIDVLNVDKVLGEKRPLVKVTWNGKKLSENVDYTCSFYTADGVNGIATVQGKGSFCNYVKKEFKYIYGNLEECSIEYKDKYEFSGEEITPEIKVINKYGKVVESKYYSVTYEEQNFGPGRYLITVKSKKNQDIYMGEKVVEYIIEPKNISKCDISYDEKVEFVGKELKPKVTIINGNIELRLGVDYSVDYRNNADKGIGVIIICGKGNYVGVIEKQFEIYVKEQIIIAH